MSYRSLPPAETQGIQVCCISFNVTDRIRLIGVPVDVIISMRSAIRSSWGPIQDESEYYNTCEFKLKGDPWHGYDEDGVRSRRLLAAVLRTMAKFGWNLLQSGDVNKSAHDPATLFFENEMPDPDIELFVLSFVAKDKIRIIDAQSPSTIAACVEKAIRSQWRNGIQRGKDYCGSIEYKLEGNPWFATGAETVNGRMLLCQIIANARAIGYKLYGSIDINVGYNGPDLESWIFRRVGPCWN